MLVSRADAIALLHDISAIAVNFWRETRYNQAIKFTDYDLQSALIKIAPAVACSSGWT